MRCFNEDGGLANRQSTAPNPFGDVANNARLERDFVCVSEAKLRIDIARSILEPKHVDSFICGQQPLLPLLGDG
ncbi:hypothetical protein ACIP1U_30780 [Cupriavidus sp. NPDC089707]|uniref:hypothetical protein n=1 Tax=Cupriavidus sp. NPDC089707 TaxID=3363963 RepID=UPI0037F13A13